MNKRILFCAVLAWVVSAGAAHAQGRHARASGSPGLGISAFSPSVPNTGRGYFRSGYVFIPNLGYVPAASARLHFPKSGGSGPLTPEPSTEDGSALLTFRVPAGAEVTVEGHKLDVVGGSASYHSRPLQPGTHTGTVVLRWVEGGRPVERTHKIKVQPGMRGTFDFTAAPAKDAPGIVAKP